jgi:signal transduction histidine kinase
VTGRPAGSGQAAGRRWSRSLRQHLGEPAFWVVQAGVATVTALHILVEAHGLIAQHEGPFASLARVPVVLYLVPVLYAGFRYGFEGGLLTGAWAAVLAVPNLFLWHNESYEWIGEGIFILFVVGLGALIAIPVEREQRERVRADAAHDRATTLNRRLALLNDVASTLVRTVDLDDALRKVLHRLMAVMDLHTAALAVRQTSGDGDFVVGPCHSVEAEARTRIARVLAATDLAGLPDRAEWLTHDVLACPVSAGGTTEGILLSVTTPGRSLTRGDVELLDAVAHQIGVALDNARLHQAERVRLHSYLQGITRAQEEERQRIARDLHDVAIHDLLLARRSLEQATGQTSDAARRVRDRIGEVIGHLRRFSRDLRPSVLDNLGLAPALEWLTAERNAQSGFTATFELSGTPRRLGGEAELALFRIAQEALRNVERHARADSVQVRLTFADDGVRLGVEDDGIGFELPAADVQHGRLGLMGMQERAELAGATLLLESRAGAGTRVTVHLTPDPSQPGEPAAEPAGDHGHGDLGHGDGRPFGPSAVAKAGRMMTAVGRRDHRRP